MLGWLGCAPVWANCKPPQAVRFPAGVNATELAGGVVRGERDCYTFRARAGQALSISQPHPVEDNIVFQLYEPHWQLAQDADGVSITGRTLPRADEGQDAREWSGKLPASGEYLLVLGTSRGSGEYRVRVQIR